MTPETIVLGLIVIGLLALLELRDRRAHTERHEQRDQITKLLQRVETPQLAPAPYEPPADVEDTPAAGFDNDAEFWQAKEANPWP